MINPIIYRQFSVALLAMMAWCLGGPGPAGAFERDKLTIHTRKGAVVLDVDIASTPAELKKGLMGRRDLPDDYGMLFNYGTPRRVAMWMKNTPAPLDMIFIDAKGKIYRIVANTTPFSTDTIPSIVPVKAVLELPAGTVEAKGISTNDMVVHPLFRH